MSRAYTLLEKLDIMDKIHARQTVANWQYNGPQSWGDHGIRKEATKIAAKTIHDPDAHRAFHPGKTMTVYRGTGKDSDDFNKEATSWTTDKSVAQGFARDNGYSFDKKRGQMMPDGGKVVSFKVDSHTPAIDVNKTLGDHSHPVLKREKEVILPDFSRPDKHPELIAHTTKMKSLGSISKYGYSPASRKRHKDKLAEPFLDYDESMKRIAKASKILEDWNDSIYNEYPQYKDDLNSPKKRMGKDVNDTLKEPDTELTIGMP